MRIKRWKKRHREEGRRKCGTDVTPHIIPKLDS